MTLKFESEILFDLMKRDGDVAPSDVLPYESELKEKYLNQVVGAYPKLQDYRPEWLNYNLYYHLPSDFPVESVANVTNAIFHDVVPYAYKSAILKGNTLVNLLTHFMSSVSYIDNQYRIIFNNDGNFDKITVVNKNSKPIRFSYYDTSWKHYDVPPFNNVLVEIPEGVATYNIYSLETFGWESTNYKSATDNIVLLHGDYVNQDIPYFKGMQSVKMPVLTTTGKNLFDKSKVKYNTTLRPQHGEEEAHNLYMTSDFINVEPNKNYVSNYMGVIFYYDENKKIITVLDTPSLPQKFTTPNNCKYVRIKSWEQYNTIEKQREIVELEQFEEESNATPYEPYKSNILTVNEEVELRGIGDIKDELNLLTSEIIKNVSDGIIDDSYSWLKGATFGNVQQFIQNQALPDMKPSSPVLSEHIKYDTSNGDYEHFRVDSAGKINLFISKDLATNVGELKTYLSTNPMPFIYCANESSVKTVDLTCINEQGESETLRPIEGTMHVNTSSQTLPPLLDMSVPVEATSQNLMSFANIVEEEK